jgi:putative LysE/RhtB family amino acid efflux pump
VLEVMGFFYRGLIIGFMISAPVGPIGLLCIRRTAQRGLPVGLATGMGAATADALFGGLATFGVSAILGVVAGYKLELQIVGAVILAFMAGNAWGKQKHLIAAEEASVGTMVSAFFSGLALTCTNPVTVLAVLAVVATLSGELDATAATIMTGGIFAGAGLWWLLLSGGVALFRRYFTERSIMIINRGTAVLLATIAVYALSTGVFAYLKAHPQLLPVATVHQKDQP